MLRQRLKAPLLVWCAGCFVLFACEQANPQPTQSPVPQASSTPAAFDTMRPVISASPIPTETNITTIVSPVKTFAGISGVDFALSPDGHQIAMNHADIIEIYDVATASLIKRLTKPAAGMMAGGKIVYSADGLWLAAKIHTEGASGTEAGVFLWSTSDWSLTDELAFGSLFSDFEISRDLQSVAATDPESGLLRIWQRSSNQAIDRRSTAFRLAFSPTEPVIASAGADPWGEHPFVDIWNLATQQEISLPSPSYDPNNPDLFSVCFSLDGRYLTSVLGGRLNLWATSDWRNVGLPFVQSGKTYTQASFLAEDKLAILDSSGQVSIVAVEAGNGLQSIQLDSNGSDYALAVSVDGSLLLTGGNGMPLQLWSINNGGG